MWPASPAAEGGIKTLAEAGQKTGFQVYASLEQMEEQLGEHRSGQLRHESAQARSETLSSVARPMRTSWRWPCGWGERPR